MTLDATMPAGHMMPTPTTPLEYETPRQRVTAPGGKRDLTLGIAAGVLISAGIGCMVFGGLLAAGWRDEKAGIFAFGVSCVSLGGCFITLMLWLRRSGR